MKKFLVFLLIFTVLLTVLTSCALEMPPSNPKEDDNKKEPQVDLSQITYEDCVLFAKGCFQISSPTKSVTTITTSLSQSRRELTSTETRILQSIDGDVQMKYILQKESYKEIKIENDVVVSDGDKITEETTTYFKKSETNASFSLTPVLSGYVLENFDKVKYTEDTENGTVTFELTLNLEKLSEVISGIDIDKTFKKGTISVTIDASTNKVLSSEYSISYEGPTSKYQTDSIKISTVYTYNTESFTYGE